MSKPPSIRFIVHYFGTWPEWADMYIYSCGHNRDIDWLIVSDCARDIFGFPNVEIMPMSLDEFRALASEKLDVSLEKVSGHGLADLKPALGLIFEGDLVGYDYFGQSDIDIIYGNLRAFYGENIRGFDVVSAHDWMVAGHLTLFRNTEKVRNAFRLAPDWREQVADEKYCSLDEKSMTLLFWDDFQTPKGGRRIAKRRGLRGLFEEQFSTSFGQNVWIDGRHDTFPVQWKWKDGSVTADSVFYREFAYCHFSHLQSGRWRSDGIAPWKRIPKTLQFDPLSLPSEFVFDKAGIRLPGRLPVHKMKTALKGSAHFKKQTKGNAQRKWCLFTAYDPNMASIADITVPNMKRYADQHGMEFRAFDNAFVDRKSYWLKIHLAQELLKQDFDYIFWVDTDAMFVDFDKSIKDEIEDEYDLYFCVENQPILGTHSRQRVNSGVFVMRNTELARDFVDLVWSTTAYDDHDWPDQAAVIAALGLNSMFMEAEHNEDVEDCQFRDSLKIMNLRWNYCPSLSDPINAETSIHHYFGLDSISKEVCLRFEEVALEMIESGKMTKEAAREIAFKSFRKMRRISEQQQAMEPLLMAYKQSRDELRSIKKDPTRLLKHEARKLKSRLFNYTNR